MVEDFPSALWGQYSGLVTYNHPGTMVSVGSESLSAQHFLRHAVTCSRLQPTNVLMLDKPLQPPSH